MMHTMDKVCAYAGGYGAARIQIPKEIEPGIVSQLHRPTEQSEHKDHKVLDQLISQFNAPSLYRA